MKKHILLVEDDEFIAKVYVHFLTKENFIVDLAESSVIARKMIHISKPDIILLDLMLPGENGFKFLEKLKSNKNTKTIPVIIVSNLSQVSDIEKCKELGASEYIVKSNFFMHEVIKRINRQIRHNTT